MARTSFFPALVLVAAGVWAYSTSFAGVFVYDDVPAIVENANIRTLWPLTQAMGAPPEVTVSGRPIAALTLAINYALAPPDARDVMAPAGPAAPPDASERFYRNVWGYHLLNLAIHLGAALALFGVVRRSLLTARLRDRFGGASTPLAFASALIWVVHPLQTESVTYVVQRVESLMGLFYLLTLYCAIRAVDDGRQHVASAFRRTKGPAKAGLQNRWTSKLWPAGSIVACALGMGCKEVMVTAPIMVWLWDVVFDVDQRRRRTLYAGLAATWVILAMFVASETRPQSVGFGLGWTWWSYLRTQAAVIVHYLRLSVLPSPLVFDYGWRPAHSLGEVAPQAMALIALAALTGIALLRTHPLGFPGAWFFLILAPTSSVLPISTEVAAEHRMYLPLAAVVVLAVVGGYALGAKLIAAVTSSAVFRRRAGLVAGLVIVCAIAATLAERTRARGRDYWSDEGLWIDTVNKRPFNDRARVGYGIDLLSAQRFADAEHELRIAVGLNDLNAHAHMNLGAALCAQGRLDDGITHLERALALDPARKETYGLLGEAYGGRGNSALSLRYFSRALELMPDNPFVLRRVAWLLATSPQDDVRNGAKAVELAERAVRITGGVDLVSLDTLATAYAEEGRFTAAAAAARDALVLAQAQRNEAEIAELQQHLALFQAGRKLR